MNLTDPHIITATATACPRCGRELLWLRRQLEHCCAWCHAHVTRPREEANR